MHKEDVETYRVMTEKDVLTYLFKVKFEDGDPSNPKNYSASHKAFLVCQMSLLALAGALGSSIIAPAEASIAEYAQVGTEVSSLAVALFVLG